MGLLFPRVLRNKGRLGSRETYAQGDMGAIKTPQFRFYQSYTSTFVKIVKLRRQLC